MDMCGSSGIRYACKQLSKAIVAFTTIEDKWIATKNCIFTYKAIIVWPQRFTILQIYNHRYYFLTENCVSAEIVCCYTYFYFPFKSRNSSSKIYLVFHWRQWKAAIEILLARIYILIISVDMCLVHSNDLRM